MHGTKRPLVVRLRNWVGEIVLSLPTLHSLHDMGYELHLIGRSWAEPLFKGTEWFFYSHPRRTYAAICQLTRLRRRACAVDPEFNGRLNMLLFTNSLSSAMEAWCAGMHAVGRKADTRSLFLARALPRSRWTHVSEEYWSLGVPFRNHSRPMQSSIEPLLPVADEYVLSATEVLKAAGVHASYVVCCPLTSTSDVGGVRRWPHFAGLTRALQDSGWQVVVCPGPGEEAAMRSACPGATLLTGMHLGIYASLLRDASVVYANDTGPGHLAAGMGARLVSIHGPQAETRWTPLATAGIVVHFPGRWPCISEVLEAGNFLENARTRPAFPSRAAVQSQVHTPPDHQLLEIS